MGASPPIVTSPIRICRDFLRSIDTYGSSARRTATPVPVSQVPREGLLAEHVEHDAALFRLVHLEQEQALPPAERGLARGDGDGVRRRREQHRLHVRMSVLALVRLGE